jgi:hypothetical protein
VADGGFPGLDFFLVGTNLQTQKMAPATTPLAPLSGRRKRRIEISAQELATLPIEEFTKEQSVKGSYSSCIQPWSTALFQVWALFQDHNCFKIGKACWNSRTMISRPVLSDQYLAELQNFQL